MEEFTKQPSEQWTIAWNFFGKLAPFSSANLASGTITAYNVTDSADATATVLFSSTMQISNWLAKCRVKDGTSGKNYQLTALVVDSDGEVYEEEVLMRVLEE